MDLRVAIVGPTGYTALWLIQWLVRHPTARVTYLASHREQLPNIAEEFPQLLGLCDLTCRPIDPTAIAREADVAFLCLPHGAAMAHAGDLLDAGLRVIDLSADFRLNSVKLYEQTYSQPHGDPANLKQAVYGLPELFADDIPEADLVANPGCYPTATALGLAPLLKAGLIDAQSLVVNAASGTTGAGRSPKPTLHFAHVNEGFAAYAAGNHRHQPEMIQTLQRAAGQTVNLLFVPHLLPVDCGILATMYADPVSDDLTEEDLFDVLEQAYDDEPFVRVRNELPNIKHVRGTNFCDLTVRLSGSKVIVFSAIDNMVKGASGQAIQNMNLMFDLSPASGLI
jgi:N-acetyl-gamma-glutamyl-phosphate reductase